MAISPYMVKFDDSFICNTRQDASVMGKRAALHEPRPWMRTPYVTIEAYVGTETSACNRIAAHNYKGCVPESPVMLGADQTAAYAQAKQEVLWGWRRLEAVCCAAAAGALLGAALAGATSLVIGGLLRLCAVKAFALPPVAQLMTSVAAGCGIGFAVDEDLAYGRASDRFEQLHTLSHGYQRLHSGMFDDASVAQCLVAVDAAFQGQDWALRQAAQEYDGKMQQFRALPIDSQNQTDS